MTDNEIIKCLQICSTYGGKCTACPAYVKVDRSNCKQVLVGALDIINRQQAEIEELREKNAGLALALLHEVVNEDEQLRNEITKVAKSEARKEFAERLKEELITSCDRVCEESGLSIYGVITGYPINDVEECIDNLLKEMGC